MKLAQYLEKRGAQAELARELGVSPVLIHQWATIRPVPISRVQAIVTATKGQVTKEDLRPDDWHLIWPTSTIQPPNKHNRTKIRREADKADRRNQETAK